MKKIVYNKLEIAYLVVCACLFSVTASADVIGAMSSFGNEMITWVRAGAIIIVIISAAFIAFGRASIAGLLGVIIGLAIAAQPEAVAALITGG